MGETELTEVNGAERTSEVPVYQMTQTEMMMEMVERSRATQKLVEGFIESMGKNPMMRAMMGRMGG